MTQSRGAKPIFENVLIGLSLLAGMAALWLAWRAGDADEAARTLQWELAFLGFALLLGGQWIVGGGPWVKKQQVAGVAAALGMAGIGVQQYYGLGWAPSTPFVVSYLGLFAAAELCFLLARDAASARGIVQYLRFGAVAWNLGWGAFYLTESYIQLPDVANLYIAFSWLWTVATILVGWSEWRRIAEIQPDRATAPTPTRSIDFSTFSGRNA